MQDALSESKEGTIQVGKQAKGPQGGLVGTTQKRKQAKGLRSKGPQSDSGDDSERGTSQRAHKSEDNSKETHKKSQRPQIRD